MHAEETPRPQAPPVLKGGRQGPGVRGKRGGLIYLKTCAIRRDVNRGEAGYADAVTAGAHGAGDRIVLRRPCAPKPRQTLSDPHGNPKGGKRSSCS